MRLAFDLDGTLIDSLQDLADSANEMVQAFGGARLDDREIAAMVGDGAWELVRRALAAAGVATSPDEGLHRFVQIYDARLLQHTRPYPGVADVLAIAARHHRLAVLTNKPTMLSKKILAALDLAGFFDEVIGGDGPHGRKPNPAGLHALSIPGAATVLIGDSPVDQATAEQAGVFFVYARYGFGRQRFGDVPPATPYVLDRPADLSAIIERLELIASGM